MRFKTPRIDEEYRSLYLHNKRLLYVLMALDYYCQVEFNKDFCVTSILRTQGEHDALYASTPEPKPPTSPHCNWEAADLRSSDFDMLQIDKIVKFLNCFTFRGGRPTALYHTIPGNAMHLHTQVAK